MKNNNTDNIVYIIHAHSVGDDQPDWRYAVANSYELAEKIAKKDEADGQIFPEWSITRMYLNTTEADI